MFPVPPLKVSPIAHIDDDLNAFIEYYLAMSQAIDGLLDPNIGNMGSCPFQVDLWIIPKNVESAVSAADLEDPPSDDEDEDEVGIDTIGNIDHRLKQSKWKYTKKSLNRTGQSNDEEKQASDSSKSGALKRVFQENLQRIINNERNKRIVIYIDRRNPKYVVSEEKCDEYIGKLTKTNDHTEAAKLKKARRKDKVRTWNDTIYFAQAPDEKFNKIAKEGHELPLNQFWASTQSMLPRLKAESTDDESEGFGCKKDFNCFQFTLSWHVDCEDVIKTYWFMQNWGTRLFPNDAHKLWPNYFSKAKDGKPQKAKPDLMKKLQERRQVVDPGFLHWYEQTTKTKLIPTL